MRNARWLFRFILHVIQSPLPPPRWRRRFPHRPWQLSGIKTSIALSLFLSVMMAALVAGSVHLQAGSAAPAPSGGDAFQPGDIAVSGFSGTKLQADRLPPGVDPISKTVIDPDGVALRIFDLNGLGGPMAGQVLGDLPKLEIKAREIGHVFGLAFDNAPANGTETPGLYAAATSAFGLQIVGPDKDGDGKPDRLKKGAPGAIFMDGQFGSLEGAGPGTVWKIDRATGAVSKFADLAVDGVTNSGPGIGGLAFDPASRTLYASDLDTGLIHRLNAANAGADLGQFDHGVVGRPVSGKPAIKDNGERMDITSSKFSPAEPATWQFTQLERRIDGLAVHDGRLYYAVAAGPEIWSVGLEPDGNFKADPRFEVGVKTEQPFLVTGIAFDRDGHLIVAQRGNVQNPDDYTSFVSPGPAQVLRFTLESPDDLATPAVWRAEADEYAVGAAKEFRSSAGGLALHYAFKADGTADLASCGGTVVMSADAFGAELSEHGVQLSDIASVRPANMPPNQSAFVDLDPRLKDPVLRGYAGGVAALQDCTGGGLPPVAGGGGFPPVSGGGGGGATFPPVTGGGGGGGTTFPPVTEEGGGGGKTIPTPGALQIVKTATVGVCSPDGGCEFNIKVSNTGGTDVPGPIVVEDSIDALTATMTGEPNAPWTCVDGPPPIKCTHPGPVPANGALEDMRVVFNPGGLDAKSVTNCAILSGTTPPVGNPGTPKAPFRLSGDDGKGLKTSVSIAGGRCVASGPCEFEIQITNTNATPLSGHLGVALGFGLVRDLLAFNDITAGGKPASVEIVSSSVLPTTKCEIRDVAVRCSTPDVSLAANASVSLKLSLKVVPPADKPVSIIGGQVFASVTPAPGQPSIMGSTVFLDKFDAVDAGPVPPVAEAVADARCATIPLDPNAPAQKGPIVVAKKGATKCTAKACTFTMTVHNVGFQDEPGPIIIDEAIEAPQAALTGEPNAPWTCTKAAPFSCTHPGPLKSDGKADLTLSFAPNTPPETTQIRNCAFVKSPAPKPLNLLAPGAGKKSLAPAMKFLTPAPDKKSDAAPLSGGDPLIQLTSFRVPARPANQSFVQLAGGTIGGNIGGVGGACKNWKPGLSNGFSINQSNGFLVSFLDLKFQGQGVTGRAQYIGSDGPVIGKVTGSMDKSGAFALVVTWPDGGQGSYFGQPGADGKASGTSVDLRGVKGTFGGVSGWKCTDICEKYATDAVENAKSYNSLQCGADVPPGRWSTDFDSHFQFCLPRATADPVMLDETSERAKILDACKVTKAAGGAAPPPAPAPVPAPAPAPAPTPPAEGGGAGDGGAGGGGAGGGGGGGGDAGGGAVVPNGEPAPEQCAVVQLDTETPADNPPPPVDPLPPVVQPEQPQASVAGPLSLTKSAGDACIDNRVCGFVVVVENKNAEAFNGTVEFDDSITGDGALFGATTMSAPPAPWTCAKSGQGFKCSANLTIAANDTSTVPFTMDLGPGIGAVKEIKNCATLKGAPTPACAVIGAQPPPVVVPPPPVVPGATSKLILAKNPVASQCSDAGGGCDFMISITNPGPEEFNGPVEFTDVPTTGDGKTFLNLTMSGGSAITAPGVDISTSCVRAGEGFKCGTSPNRPAKIAAGKTALIPMSFTPGGGTGAKSIKNCAQLTGSAERPCVNIPLVNGPLLRALKQGGGSTCIPSCAFSISVKNIGNQEAEGPIAFDDVFTPASEATNFEMIDGDFNCAKTGATARCVAKNKPFLKVGETVNVRLKVSGVAQAPQYENCIVLVERSGVALLKDFPGRCVTVKETAPPVAAKPNLVISKVSTSNGTCDVTKNCPFRITVTNNSDVPFDRNILVVEQFPEITDGGIRQPVPAGVESIANPEWDCRPIRRGVNCVKKPIGLAARASVTLDVLVTPGPNWKKNDTLENCASLVDGAVEQKSCAKVKLDPFAVKVAKSGDQSCAPGSDCNFKITLFNPGPIDHIAPVTITDKLTGIASAQIISITPPLPCATQPTQIPFSCTSAGDHPLLLGPNGEPATPEVFDMVVRLPTDMTAATFSNCASVSGEANGQNAASPDACATVQSTQPLPPPVEPAPVPPPPPPAATCVGGMVLTAGLCGCPPDQVWNGRACAVDPGSGGSNGVQPSDDDRLPVKIEPRPKSSPCPDGFVGKPPNCCPRGTEFRNGACRGPRETPPPTVRRCPEGFIGTPPDCCPRGTEFRRGKCRSIEAPDAKPVDRCPASRPVGDYPNCCPLNTRFKNGACRSTQCPTGTTGVPPVCCPRDQRYVNGQCIPRNRPQIPTQPQPTRPPQPPVVCPPGTVKVNGQCRRVAIPTPAPPPKPRQKCPPPTVGTFPNCITPQCPPLQIGVPPNCMCQPPFVKIAGQCVFVQPKAPDVFKGPK